MVTLLGTPGHGYLCNQLIMSQQHNALCNNLNNSFLRAEQNSIAQDIEA